VNPFAALGLPPSAGLSDEDVRAAWRTVADATHPDRGDGGDPKRFAAAAVAYEQLRTPRGRARALAGLGTGYIPPPDQGPRPGPAAMTWRRAQVLAARIRHGRPRHIAARGLAAAAAACGAAWLVPGTPAESGVIVAAATWWLLTSRGDLAPPPGR
jgi:hypothetical protein